MTRIARLVVLAAMAALALSSTAHAVTWHNSGSTAFTATGGPGTLSSTSAALACSGTTGTGTATAAPFVGATWSAFHGTVSFTGCLVSGITTGVECGFTMTATTAVAGGIGGTFDVTCGIFQFGTKICHIGGSLEGTYVNPVQPSTKGRFTLNTGGSLVMSNGAAGVCPLGNGDRGHLAEKALTITTATGGSGTLGPVLTRTA